MEKDKLFKDENFLYTVYGLTNQQIAKEFNVI